MSQRLPALRAVAVVRWLRRHPLVEAGPGVRASQALAELAVAGTSLSPSEPDAAFLRAALVALPHRLRVRPGTDADALVRQAVAEALLAPPEPTGTGRHDDEDADPGDSDRGDERLGIAVPSESAGHRPATTDEERAAVEAFGDDEAARFLDGLLDPGAALPPAAGPAPTRPGRRAVGEEILAVRPFRPGDRARDFSARQTVRASLRTGSLAPRALSRQPSAVWDVVVALDASASMGRTERPVVAPATAALTRVLVRRGHRVGAVAFSEEAVLARPLSRGRAPFLAEDYAFAHATNIEAGIDAARLLLLREAAAGARRHIVLVTDAECTSHSGSDEAWGVLGAPRGHLGMARLLAGGMVDAARRAALIAASRCRRHGITLSVAYPDSRSEVEFAHRLAEAGGGRAGALRP
ncbi:MAG TPA: VWA domain-containing protein [Acidimicrobiia bacterium]|nr:VWA domain-containing protein [Acidimicrobiia bacterium]